LIEVADLPSWEEGIGEVPQAAANRAALRVVVNGE
jgi:hypothetical protein